MYYNNESCDTFRRGDRLGGVDSGRRCGILGDTLQGATWEDTTCAGVDDLRRIA